MNRLILLGFSVVAVFATACHPNTTLPRAALGKSTLAIANHSGVAVAVNIAFGADSVVLPAALPCVPTSPRNCAFQLPNHATQVLDLGGAYLNATFAFGAGVGCGSTKVELNLNNPAWYDTADISLVDGYNGDAKVQFGGVLLGPTHGKDGNASALGVFPLGCDICVARQNPSCGISPSPTPGSAGCKAGSQYARAVSCQVQGLVKGGGTAVEVVWLPILATMTQ